MKKIVVGLAAFLIAVGTWAAGTAARTDKSNANAYRYTVTGYSTPFVWTNTLSKNAFLKYVTFIFQASNTYTAQVDVVHNSATNQVYLSSGAARVYTSGDLGSGVLLAPNDVVTFSAGVVTTAATANIDFLLTPIDRF